MRDAMKRRYKTLKEAIKELGEGFGIQLVDKQLTKNGVKGNYAEFNDRILFEDVDNSQV